VPELPEVETVVRELRPRLVGRRLAGIRVSRLRLRQPWSSRWDALVVGRRVQDVRRRGKWIVIDLDQDRHLVLHLGMTGQLTVVKSREPVRPHTHWVAALYRRQQQLRFCDIRRFGSALFLPSSPRLAAFFEQAQLGPEPFQLDSQYWWTRLSGTRRCLKAVLLDQRVVAGVGNIYADEALFEACLFPGQLGINTNRLQAERLRRAIPRVLRRAIERRGSSIRNYIGASGRQGGYQKEFRVYGRAGEPCLRCRNSIQRVRLAGRSTHFCPRCQAQSRTRAAAVRASWRAAPQGH
jgi:formamidopyrimidine-DNA glycosylase